MKEALVCLLLALALALPCAASAQRIEMDAAHLAFDYPDDWLVVSPQLSLVYAPLLEDAGLDAQSLSQELTQLGVHSRAYNAGFTEWVSVQTRSDELSEEIFDIDRVTDAQRRTIKNRAQSDSLWETTGLRAQDVQWQREGGVYWLYIHYTRTRADEIVGRGLRYVTIRNGQYVMLDWQTDGRRFTGRDLRDFRAMIAKLTVTEILKEPMRTVRLAATIPAETATARITIEGSATAGATLTATAPDASGAEQVLSVGEVGSSGAFLLLVELEREGKYDITLTAQKDGMLEASVQGSIAYSANTLPVSLSGIPEDGVVTTDKVTITGETLSGVQMQLVTPFGMTKKRSANDGSFSFELTTADEGSYNYTLICDRSGYDQRRIQFTLTRVMTDEQGRQQIRNQAASISYRELQRDLESNRGKTVRVYGPVISVEEGGGQYYVRMQYNRDGKGRWYNDIVVTSQEAIDVRVGDMLTVVATVGGVYEEQDASGADVMIPRLDLLFVDAVE